MLKTYCNKINRLTTPCQKEKKSTDSHSSYLVADIRCDHPLYNLAVLNKVTKKCRLSLLSLF